MCFFTAFPSVCFNCLSFCVFQLPFLVCFHCLSFCVFSLPFLVFSLSFLSLCVSTACQCLTRRHSISNSGRATCAVLVVADLLDAGGALGKKVKAAFISTGFFDLFIGAVAAVEQRGPELLRRDTDTYALTGGVLKALRYFCDDPECERKIRGVAGGLRLCMEVNVEFCKALHLNTAGGASLICARVFGRDEERSDLSFTQVNTPPLPCVSSWLRQCLCLVFSTAFVAKTVPLPCVSLLSSWPRQCLCLVCFHCLRGQDSAFALCFHCLRGQDSAFALCHCLRG